MNRREMIAGLGAAVVAGASTGAILPQAKFTRHLRSKVGDIGSQDTRVWLDGVEITHCCRSLDTELGVVEVIVREPTFHIARHFGVVRVHVGGTVYPS